MSSLKLLSKSCLAIAVALFIVYLLERLSASSHVPIDLFSVQAIVMFPLLLAMAFFVGASFMIESHLPNE